MTDEEIISRIDSGEDSRTQFKREAIGVNDLAKELARGFIDNVRRRLNRPALAVTEVPSGMVKDVVLPKYRVPEF